MVTKSPTPILIDTAILSQIVSDILEIAGAPSTKKSACLNKAAARIAGNKHNFGYLTGRKAPVIANGVKGLSVTEDRSPAKDAVFGEQPIIQRIGETGSNAPDIQTGRSALHEAERTVALHQPPKLRIDVPFDAQNFITFIESHPGLSARVAEYMRKNIEAVQESIESGETTTAFWERAARLTQILDESIEHGTDARQKNHREQLTLFLDLHLGPQAEELKSLIGI